MGLLRSLQRRMEEKRRIKEIRHQSYLRELEKQAAIRGRTQAKGKMFGKSKKRLVGEAVYKYLTAPPKNAGTGNKLPNLAMTIKVPEINKKKGE